MQCEQVVLSKDLAIFQLYFVRSSLKAFIGKNGLLTIGINHTNQDHYPFDMNSLWTVDHALEAWRHDLRWQKHIVCKWLKVPLDVNQFEALIDLMCDDIMLHGARPVTLFKMINAGDFEHASDQFLRWIVDLDGQVNLTAIKRAFARRALFNGFAWKHYATCPTRFGDLVPLNDLLSLEGYRVVSNLKVGFVIERVA